MIQIGDGITNIADILLNGLQKIAPSQNIGRKSKI